ncbi:MAG: FAD-binding oxidoreductase [Phycisphaerales bacterium]
MSNSAEIETNTDFPDPVLPAVEMHLHRPTAPATAVVTRNEVCSSRKAAGFVRHIELDIAQTDIAGRFRAGQSFGVLPPGENDKGRPHAPRLYSIASPTRGEDGQGRILATTVKRTIDEHWDDHRLFLGVASNYLCDLQVGEEVRVTGPNGKRFLLPEDHHTWNYLFFATGTGIAPFRGMLGDLFAPGTAGPGSATLVMGSPYRSDLLYDAELRDLARAEPGFEYLPTISREPNPDADGRGLYVQDRLLTHRERLTEILSRDRTLVYICGIAGMEIGIFQQLAFVLPPEVLPRFLDVDPEIAGGPSQWTRRMIHKQLKPTRRVFLEVY